MNTCKTLILSLPRKQQMTQQTDLGLPGFPAALLRSKMHTLIVDLEEFPPCFENMDTALPVHNIILFHVLEVLKVKVLPLTLSLRIV